MRETEAGSIARMNVSRFQEFVLEDRHKRIKVGRAVIAVCVCAASMNENGFPKALGYHEGFEERADQ
jgi:hypothetical protein